MVGAATALRAVKSAVNAATPVNFDVKDMINSSIKIGRCKKIRVGLEMAPVTLE
jgi:hypothetical protein